MRKWPVALRLLRNCVKDYRLTDERGNSYQIHAGDKVLMPIVGLHMDPDYFPDPYAFDPERFSEQRKHLMTPFTYLPFGAGPRSCIGESSNLSEMRSTLCSMAAIFFPCVCAPFPQMQAPVSP